MTLWWRRFRSTGNEDEIRETQKNFGWNRTKQCHAITSVTVAREIER